QQHQELLLMDIKHVLSLNPLNPVYGGHCGLGLVSSGAGGVGADSWRAHDGGVVDVGYNRDSFCFANKKTNHDTLLTPFDIAPLLVRGRDGLAFIDDGGYRRAELWMSDGWATVNAERWSGPLYWHEVDGEWFVFTLAGLRAVDGDEPVCHVSWYEADAF